MKVDVYHYILGKVHELANGQTKKMINMLDIVKKEGFASSKDDIFEFMTSEGWVVDAPAPGQVFITPWGMEEHKRFSARNKPDRQKQIEDAVKEANKAAGNAREFADTFEQFAKELTANEAEAKKLHSKAMTLFDEIKKSVAATKID